MHFLVRTARVMLGLWLSCAVCGSVAAQDSMADEYAKQIKSAEAIGALGNDLFGEKTNFYTGVTDFSATDVSVPGNDALPVSVGRRFSLRQSLNNALDGIFADWDLDLPHLSTLGYQAWQVEVMGNANRRCTYANPPPEVIRQNITWTAEEYWSGHQLYVPGQGDQEMLALVPGNQNRPTTGGPYHWTTSGNWYFSCVPIDQDASNEGFLGLAPDGTRYRFDWLVSRTANSVQKTGTAPGTLKTGGAQLLSPINSILPRKEFWLLPTLATDRFGNTVTYAYDATYRWRLNSITASDGRQITFSYNAEGFVSAVSDGVRTWNYSYDANGLRTVTLPGNNGAWQYSLNAVRIAHTTTTAEQTPNNMCYGLEPVFPTTHTGTITHPSGAQGEFSFDTIRHGRSYVIEDCKYTNYPTSGYAYFAYLFDTLSLISKKISGPGLTTAQWTYSYGPPNNSYVGECTGTPCPATKTVEVTGPTSWTRYTFGNKFLDTDGKLLKVETGSGPSDILHTEITSYQIDPAGQPYPAQIGDAVYSRGDGTSEKHAPTLQRQTVQQGVTFSWHADTFDAYANPARVTRASSLGHTRTDTTAYYHDTAKWIIGQVASSTNENTGLVETSTEYGANASPWKVKAFGKLQQTMTYHVDGTLATVTDGNNHVTTFSNWKRGIPRSIVYHDTSNETADVNDVGWLLWVNDENQYRTCYGYDAMGRLASITYPAQTATNLCDNSASEVTLRSFAPVNTAEYGLPAGHWKQTISTGNGIQATYYDGLWRPVLEEKYDAADKPNTLSQTVKRYDAEGRLIFQSYPSRTVTSVQQSFAALQGAGGGAGWYASALLSAAQMPTLGAWAGSTLGSALPPSPLRAPICGAQVVWHSTPSTMYAGQTYSVTVDMRNTGTATWSAAGGYALGSANPENNTVWGLSRVPVPFDIIPTDTAGFNFDVTAPTTPGTYNFQWQMVCGATGFYFGPKTTNVQVVVQPPPVDGASFVEQSAPSQMQVGQSYSVSVTMQNTGTTTWTSAANYKLASTTPQDNWGVTRAALPGPVAPGQSATFSFNVTAPSTPGSYGFQWRMLREGVAWFGASSNNVQVDVQPPPVDGAGFVEQNVPPQMLTGQSYPVSVTMKNTGTTTWTAATNYKLGSANPQDNTRWGISRVTLPSSVAPGQSATFSFNVTAPATVGSHAFQWQMLREGVAWFGAASDNVQVNVQAQPIADDAAYVTQSLPGTMVSGQAYPISVQMRNTGTNTWSPGSYRLALSSPANPAAWGTTSTLALDTAITPGQTATFNTTVVAPAAGSYAFQWRMVKNGTGFGAPTQNTSVQVQAASTALLGVRTFYDALGRPIRVEQDSELGILVATTEYLANFQTRVTNPRLVKTTTSYMAYDQPSTDWPKAIVQGEGLADAAYVDIARDVFGKPTAFTRRDAASTLSATRSYAYNSDQRLCRSTEPETGATLLGYDDAGNLLWSASGIPAGTACDSTDAGVVARRVNRTYDVRNRLKTLVFPDGVGNQVWDYTSDGLPSQITTYNAAASGDPIVNGYGYNTRRLLTSESSGQPGGYTWNAGYVYDRNGNLASQTYPTGLSVAYAPNALGQATRAGDFAQNVAYYPNGAIKQFTYGNGVVHSMSQNARQLPAWSVDSGVSSYQTSFDGNGNVDAIYDQARGSHYSRWMEYDNLDRLTAAGSCSFGGDCWHRFTYDALDNLKSWKLAGVKDYANYYYDPSSQRLTNIQNSAAASIVGMSYDPQGNLANKNGQAYTFDYGNRLRAVPGKETYRYDGHGRRVLNSRTDGTFTVSQYAQSGQLIYQEKTDNTIASEHIYLAGSLVATRERNWTTSTYATKYQHTDALGSPVAVSDQAGQVIDRTDYEPYGAAIGKPTYDGVGYTGHVMDGATGLSYMQQRYYDPQIGRFLSLDPVTADASTGANFNRYWYANNNPYRFTDPDGRQSFEENQGPVRSFAEFRWRVWQSIDSGIFHTAGQAMAADGAYLVGVATDNQALQDVAIEGMRENVSTQDGINAAMMAVGPRSGRGAPGEGTAGLSPRAAAREVMRQEGIPTSQQAKSQSSPRGPGNTPAGRERVYDTTSGEKRVQHQLQDRNHGPHWEAGSAKPGGQTDPAGRPRLTNDKKRVDE